VSRAALQPLYIVGTGGLAREIAHLVDQINQAAPTWSVAGFIAESADEVGRDLGSAAVIGDDASFLGGDTAGAVAIGIGHPAQRARAATAYLPHKGRLSFPNLVHPTAVLDPGRVQLGQGNTVFAGCVFSCDIRVGDFNHFNWLCTIGHDARIGCCNVINPSSNVSGGVTLGDTVLVGAGEQILEGLAVGSGATVGAGAVVLKPVDPNTTVVGVPARPLATHA
jgi:UDP-N-acetylbacillosamine N-acetyltransferase